MECFTKNGFDPLIIVKHSILHVWQGSDYASGLLKLFCHGSKRMFDMCWTGYSIQSKLRLFWTYTGKYNIQANERLTKIKEK